MMKRDCLKNLLFLPFVAALTLTSTAAAQDGTTEQWKPTGIVDFVLHDSTVCAVAADYEVTCYNFEQRRRFTLDERFKNVGLYRSFYTMRICGVQPDDSLKCIADESLEDVPSGAFRDVQLWFHGACALDVDGRMHCWGQIRELLKEEPDLAERLQLDPQRAAPAGTFESMSVSGSTACAVRADGQTKCWSPGAVMAELGVVRLGRPMRVAKVEGSGGDEVCGILRDGGVRCWGDERISFTRKRSLEDEKADATLEVLGGDYIDLTHSVTTLCALRRDHRVDCVEFQEAETLPLEPEIAQIAMERDVSCGLTVEGGELFCWDTRTGPSQPRSFE